MGGARNRLPSLGWNQPRAGAEPRLRRAARICRVEKPIRPLSEKERRLLSSALAWRRRRVHALRRRSLFIGLTIFVVFWAMMVTATVADKRGPAWYYSCLMAIAIALLISLWTYFELRPKFTADVAQHENALHRNEARVTRIQSNAMVEFEEAEDEGACHAFQLDQGRIVFVSGQDFYDSAKFPNSDFSLVDILADDGRLIESFIEKNGTRLKALRKISSRQKAGMRIPEHLEIIEGDLHEIEQILLRGSN